MSAKSRIFLSPPHMSGEEIKFINNAFSSNWIAPVGPAIDAFEEAVTGYTGATNAVALASGTAAIHLALHQCGVQPGDDVFCSDLTFAGSAFPITYLQATPVFIDCEEKTWNMDPELLRKAIRERDSTGKRPAAVIVVHLYGQSADVNSIQEICTEFSIPLIEDAAESLGTYYGNMHTGTIGKLGILSFNGNKIITTSGGGMLIGKDTAVIENARYLSTQARDSFPWYEHSVVGYNYRMSNILAAIGCGQIRVIEERVRKKREIYELYARYFENIDGISLIPRDVYGRSNCWLTCIIINQEKCCVSPERFRIALEKENIESRPLWKPMHQQPVFTSLPAYLNGVSDRLFSEGLCLPSGTAMNKEDMERIISVVLELTDN